MSLIKKIISLIRRAFLDENEKLFLLKSPFSKSILQSTKSIVLVQTPMDYFYVSFFSVLSNELSEKLQARRVGLWPYNVEMVPYDSKQSLVDRSLYASSRKLTMFLNFIKWAKVYKGAGVRNHIKLGGVGFFQNIKNAKEAAKIFGSLTSKQQLLDLVINDVHCGDLIYDTYIRFRAVHTVDIKDEYLRYLIHQCLNGQQSVRDFFQKNQVEVLLSSYSSYIQHGIPVREALRLGVTVYTAGTFSQYIKKLSLTDVWHTPDHQSYANKFAQLTDKAERLKVAKTGIEPRFLGVIDSATKYMRSSAYSDQAGELPDGVEGVVFLHDFFDSPHCYRTMLFEDFWEWAVYTLQTIQDHGLKIAVKPHPNQVPESIVAVNALKQKFPKVQWLDSAVSNKSIFKSGIKCGFSVYGTILHELAYHGIAAVAAGDHPHVAFNIAYTPQTRNDYKEKLLDYVNLRVPEGVKNEVLAFYYMHNLYNKEAIYSKGTAMKLRDLDPNRSESLVQFLSKLELHG